MALRIHKASDPIEITQAKVLIYGQPGIGKSSFGFTSEAPLLLDFDGGAHRSAFRQDIVPIGSWGEVATITAEDLKPYKTVVLDTVGRALDFLAAALIEDNPKFANKQGALSLQGFGALKSSFAGWLGRLNALGLDVVMIAHDKETTNERDVRIVRPDVTGGSYNEIFKLADSVGYMFADGKKRVLDFSPTENYVGKNPAQFELIQIPDYTQEPRFAAGLIADIKGALGKLSAEAQKVVAAVNAFRERMPEITTAEEMTALLAEVDKLEEPVKAMCKRVMLDRCAEIGVEYDKKAKAFKAKEPEKEAAA